MTSAQATDLFVAQRGKTHHHAALTQLPGLSDSDLMMAQRGSTKHQATGAQVKQFLSMTKPPCPTLNAASWATHKNDMDWVAMHGHEFQYCTSLKSAWASGTMAHFPAIDAHSAFNLNTAWHNCANLTKFDVTEFSSATIFTSTWESCASLTVFPRIRVLVNADFRRTWYGCSSLVDFGGIDLPNGVASNAHDTFQLAWAGCVSLSPQSLEVILADLDNLNINGVQVAFGVGCLARLTPTGQAALASLQAKGWTITEA